MKRYSERQWNSLCYRLMPACKKAGDVGYALREGPHDMTAWDWKQFCNFEAAQAAKD